MWMNELPNPMRKAALFGLALLLSLANVSLAQDDLRANLFQQVAGMRKS